MNAYANDKFISIADIHFDPFFDCNRWHGQCELIVKLNHAPYEHWESILDQYSSNKIAGAGNDTNYNLLKLSLNKLKEKNQEIKPQYVFVLGDFLAHHFDKKYKKFSGDSSKADFANFVKKTLQFLTFEIQKSFPQSEIYPVVGNNDSYTGDYGTVPNGKFFNDMEAVWSKLIVGKNNLNSFHKTFPIGGYYAIDTDKNKNLKFIILNSVLFASKSKGPDLKQAAANEFRWLRQQLQAAKEKKQSVYLLLHIPPGIDVFATLRVKFFFIQLFWHKEYGEELVKILKEFPGTVKAIFPAHIHMDTMQLLPVGNSSITEYFTPSVSPIFGNAPGFKTFMFDKDYQIVSYDTFYVS